jgi:hypothetical protein
MPPHEGESIWQNLVGFRESDFVVLAASPSNRDADSFWGFVAPSIID